MYKILVIDDEKELLEEIVDNLTFNGYEAAGISESVHIIETVETYKPDLIVCDVMMPNMDGYEVLLEIRANAEQALIPFIFLTAKAEHEAVRHGMGMGANDYLTKPFTFKELLKVIETQLKLYEKIKVNYHQKIHILEQQVYEEQYKQHLKSNFLSMVAHDLRTPLTVIMSSSQLVRTYEDRLSAERKLKHLLRIEETVVTMMQIIDNLTWLSNVESESLNIRYERVDLAKLCRQLVEWFQPAEAQTHQIEIISGGVTLTYGDIGLLRQAIMNLLSNAVKYSPQGTHVKITINTMGDDIEVGIHDQGIGIPEKDKDRLFQAFQRASNTDGIQGTGVGLTVVKLAAELHNGSVSFISSPQNGTTFMLRIPILVDPIAEGI